MIEVSRRDLDRSAPPVVQPLRVLAAEFTAHGANPTDDSVIREPSLLGDGFKSHACCARARDGKQLLLRDNAPRHGRQYAGHERDCEVEPAWAARRQWAPVYDLTFLYT